jgi:hypothetical protein
MGILVVFDFVVLIIFAGASPQHFKSDEEHVCTSDNNDAFTGLLIVSKVGWVPRVMIGR